jgi:hypothetical protein
MAYLSTIPQATDRIKDSQSQLLNNFIALDGLLSVNTPRLNLSPLAATPALALGNLGLMAKTSTLSTLTEMYIARGTGGGSTLTEFTSYGSGLGLVNQGGWTRLPSGILMKWDRHAFIQPVPATITFTWPVAATIPAFANAFNCQLTLMPLLGFPSVDFTLQLKSFDATTVTMDVQGIGVGQSVLVQILVIGN